jgi:hypothetical protein
MPEKIQLPQPAYSTLLPARLQAHPALDVGRDAPSDPLGCRPAPHEDNDIIRVSNKAVSSASRILSNSSKTTFDSKGESGLPCRGAPENLDWWVD